MNPIDQSDLNIRLDQLLYYLRLFIKSKIIFLKPKKKDYLVLDKLYIQIFSKYLGKDNFNILKIRGEETNIYVLIFVYLQSTGFTNYYQIYPNFLHHHSHSHQIDLAFHLFPFFFVDHHVMI